MVCLLCRRWAKRHHQAAAKFAQRKIANSLGDEPPRGRVEDSHGTGVLGHGFFAGSFVAADAEGAERPGGHRIVSGSEFFEEEDSFLTRLESGNRFDGYQDVAGASSGEADGDLRRRSALERFDDRELRACPHAAALQVAGRICATHARHCVCSAGQLIKIQPGQSGSRQRNPAAGGQEKQRGEPRQW
jgi:hypothetical protein